eukprot:15463525-Alexandrium_andersonii.AAC.1
MIQGDLRGHLGPPRWLARDSKGLQGLESHVQRPQPRLAVCSFANRVEEYLAMGFSTEAG